MTKVDQSQPLVEHLRELRNRLVWALGAVLVLFVALYSFSGQVYAYLAAPMMSLLDEQSSTLIATGIASPFLVPLKLCLVAAFFFAMPFMLYQIWAFVAPALYKNEKRAAMPLFISSVILFYLGTAFAYYVVLPITFNFLTSVAPEGVQVLPDIQALLDFSIKMFFAFGLAFEIPVATYILVLTGFASVESLRKKRPYVIVACFAVGMLITPPDAFSQTLLAIPMWILFELGLVFAPKSVDAS